MKGLIIAILVLGTTLTFIVCIQVAYVNSVSKECIERGGDPQPIKGQVICFEKGVIRKTLP